MLACPLSQAYLTLISQPMAFLIPLGFHGGKISRLKLVMRRQLSNRSIGRLRSECSCLPCNQSKTAQPHIHYLKRCFASSYGDLRLICLWHNTILPLQCPLSNHHLLPLFSDFQCHTQHQFPANNNLIPLQESEVIRSQLYSHKLEQATPQFWPCTSSKADILSPQCPRMPIASPNSFHHAT